MSQQNAEVMKAAVERFNRGGEDDALLEEFYAPEAVYHSLVESLPIHQL